MIKGIKIPADFLLSNFFGSELTFTEGINVIYGPNGTGKSFLLDTLAHNTFIDNKGWSKPVGFRDTGFIYSFYKYDIKEFLLKKDYGKCTLDWDGVACFKTEGILSKGHTSRIVSEIMCGCTNKQDISYENLKKIVYEKLSSGQTASLYVETLLSLTVPDLCEHYVEYGADYINLVANYLKPLPRDGKPTLLIDEIDGVFDFDNLYKFWNETLPTLAEKYQILIVTHNPFFIREDMNIIGKEFYLKSLKLLNNK